VTERVVEIIVYIMSEMRLNQQTIRNMNFKVISKKLSDDGYTEKEINSALTWMIEKFKADKKMADSTTPYRLLHEFEKMTITPEAYGYLIQLQQLGLVNEIEIEQVIERAMITEIVPVTLNQMKEIVSAIIFKPVDLSDSSFFIMDDSFNVH
jgi:uncharacterized protein Smg (DUF494 family)